MSKVYIWIYFGLGGAGWWWIYFCWWWIYLGWWWWSSVVVDIFWLVVSGDGYILAVGGLWWTYFEWWWVVVNIFLLAVAGGGWLVDIFWLVVDGVGSWWVVTQSKKILYQIIQQSNHSNFTSKRNFESTTGAG